VHYLEGLVDQLHQGGMSIGVSLTRTPFDISREPHSTLVDRQFTGTATTERVKAPAVLDER
jgi:hypothetical protein